MQISTRSNSSESYRYGFGGHEKDDEVKGGGNHLSFGDYGYDARLGRRPSSDPISVPWESGYAAFRNNPMVYVDPDGRWPYDNKNIRDAEYMAARYGGRFVKYYKNDGTNLQHAMVIKEDGSILNYPATKENQKTAWENTSDWFDSLSKRGAQTNGPGEHNNFSEYEMKIGMSAVGFVVTSASALEVIAAKKVTGWVIVSWINSADDLLGLVGSKGAVSVQLVEAVFGKKAAEYTQLGKGGVNIITGVKDLTQAKEMLENNPTGIPSAILDVGNGSYEVWQFISDKIKKNNGTSSSNSNSGSTRKKPSTTLEPGDE